jgi:hypothetical protein
MYEGGGKTGSKGGAHKYFYGVIYDNAAKRFGDCGVYNREVYSIPYKDVSIVVSDAPSLIIEFDEENLRSHSRALSRVMEDCTIIPSEFGTVIGSEKILLRLMDKCYRGVVATFKIVNGTAELGIKIIPEDKTKVDHSKIDALINDLKAVSNQVIFGDRFSERIALNASFLVKKGDYDVFSGKIDEFTKACPDLKVLYSGPWAPYNFVRLKIGKNGINLDKNGG